MKRASLFVPASLAAMMVVAALQPAMAGERGKFQGHAVLEVTKFTEYKALEGHPMKSAMAAELDGLFSITAATPRWTVCSTGPTTT